MIQDTNPWRTGYNGLLWRRHERDNRMVQES